MSDDFVKKFQEAVEAAVAKANAGTKEDQLGLAICLVKLAVEILGDRVALLEAQVDRLEKEAKWTSKPFNPSVN